MFGSHLSIAGSLLNALDEAVSLKLDTVQIFTKNQQQWKARPLDPGIVRDWRARTAELGWQDRTVSHASYLINLASPNDDLWRKSIDLMLDEIERCEALGVPLLVHHAGAFTTSSREAGLTRIASAYGELFKQTRGFRTVSCLENTVGSGSNLGREFDELALLRSLIIEATGEPERIAFCFDTCHAHAGGYDLSSAELAGAALRAWDAACGLASIRVLHVNDSKAAAGSRRDLHEHIGLGTIGLKGFGAIVTHPAFRDRPKILETPKGESSAGVPHDVLNLRKLRKLSAPADPAGPATRSAARRPRVRAVKGSRSRARRGR